MSKKLMSTSTLLRNKLIWDRTAWDNIGQLAVISLAFAIPVSTALTNILCVIILVAWLLGPRYSEKWAIFQYHPLVQWLYPLIGLSFLGVIYSVADLAAIQGGLRDCIRLLVIPVFIYFFSARGVSRLAFFAFLSAMILTLVLAFLKVYFHFPIGLKYSMGGVFKCHIKTSFFMAISVFFLASQVKQNKPYWLRLLLISLIMLMVYYLLFMNAGRIGYMVLVLGTLILAWQRYRFKGIAISALLALITIIGAYATSDIFSQRINLLAQDFDFYQQGGRLHESSLGSRITFATNSLTLIKEHPLLGWGTGSFGSAYEKTFADQHTLLTDNPHNEYLRITVEFGLLGLACLLLLLYQQWRLSRQLPLEVRYLWQGIFITFITGCLFNSWLRDFTEGYYFSLMTAMVFAWLPIRKQVPLVNAVVH
ncbi:MAG: O-antigen ligase family protein [Candidatus Berkiellales bacterium]